MDDMFFKNVSRKNIVIGDLNITWAPNKVINFGRIDINESVMDVLKQLIDQGWIVNCDENGELLLTPTSISKISDIRARKESQKEKLMKDRMHLIEYARKKDDPNFDPDELKKLGDVFVLKDKIKLKSLLNMHVKSAKKLLMAEKYTMDDLEDLKLIMRHESRASIIRYVRSCIWHLEHPRTSKDQSIQESGLE